MKSPKKKQEYNLPHALQSRLDEEELKLYEEYFNTESTRKIRQKLVELLESMGEASLSSSEKTNKYESPSWSEYQADAIGYRRALRELKKLIG